ncbi:Conserved_hypothetical protein [Hexamita inflata]|uniref:Transmembrane protein n=1 Tax=Hexamita inflata TaxID=28002 RepID=A0AA86U7Y5_9EUKA|nr:Conserved hypothetical protein [Hexamita inflata]
MILDLCLVFSEMLLIDKRTMYNCFNTNADVNIRVDTNSIEINLNSTRSNSCNIPHGIMVSISIDSLGSYQPFTYVLDFNYSAPQQIVIQCQNAACANIKSSESAVIILETKIEATFIPAGSIKVSRGIASNCFNDNESYFELNQGFVVAVLYPTLSCVDAISTFNSGQYILNPIVKAKIYITYTDDSVSIHDQFTITTQNNIFIPAAVVTDSSVPIRIILQNQNISKYFSQNQINTTIPKDIFLFQLDMYFQIGTIVKTVQTTINFYKYTGLPPIYDSLNILLLDSGFVLQKQFNPLSSTNSVLQATNFDSYSMWVVFTTYDVDKTDLFRERLFLSSNESFSFTSSPEQINFDRFANGYQFMNKLHSTEQELYMFICYQFFKNGVVVQNYSQAIDEIKNSCFSTGIVNYDVLVGVIQIQNTNQCAIQKNDAITAQIKILSEIITYNIDFVPGKQTFSVHKDLHSQPEVYIWFWRDGTLVDAVRVTEYQIKKTNKLINEQIVILTYVLIVNLIITLAYVILKLIIIPPIQAKAKNQKKFYFVVKADEEVEA